MEGVGQPIEHQRVEAGVEQQYLRAGARGGISLADGVDVPSDLPGEIYSGSAQAADLFRRILCRLPVFRQAHMDMDGMIFHKHLK